MIKPGESIWEFEMKGSRRSDVYADGFYGVKRDLFPYRHHVVERGKWFPWEAWSFGRKGIGCDFSRRKVMTFREASRWLTQKGVSLFLEAMPGPARQVLIDAVRGVKKYVR